MNAVKKNFNSPFVLRALCNVELPVRDRKRSLAFYRDRLGLLCRVGTGGTWQIIADGTAISLLERDDVAAVLTIAFEIPPWEMLSARQRLVASGISVEGPVDRLGQEQVLLLKDPDGHRIELVSRGAPSELTKAVTQLSEHPGVKSREQSWEDLYESVSVEVMPWYSERLEEDLLRVLSEHWAEPGRWLELGCGPGTAAARVASLGYEVVAVDIAPAAISQARSRFAAVTPRLRYEVADVTRPVAHLGRFSYAFDRGCFHSLAPEDRPKYVDNVADVLEPGGRLFLKTFSRDEPGTWGPHRFNGKEIEEIFAPRFSLLFQTGSTFAGSGNHYPKAVFSVLSAG